MIENNEKELDTISCNNCPLLGYCVGGFPGEICDINPYGKAQIVE